MPCAPLLLPTFWAIGEENTSSTPRPHRIRAEEPYLLPVLHRWSVLYDQSPRTKRSFARCCVPHTPRQGWGVRQTGARRSPSLAPYPKEEAMGQHQEIVAGSALRRIIGVLAVAAVMAAIMVAMASPAFAGQRVITHGPNSGHVVGGSDDNGGHGRGPINGCHGCD